MKTLFSRIWRRITPSIPIAVLLFLVVNDVRLARQGYNILELTKRPPSGSDPLENRMPGASVSGIIGGDPNRSPGPYALPLQLTIQSITNVNIGTSRTSLIVEILLRNSGTTTFYLPVSFEHSKAMATGNKGRRTFLFKVRFRSVGRPETTTVAVSTDGSQNDPKSFMGIPPGESVLVRFQAELSPIWDWIESGVREVETQAVLSEWTLEEDRYFIKAQSQEVRSQNVVRVSIQP